jgi:replicative DNA helicase
MLDLQILRVLKYKENYDKVFSSLDKDALDPRTMTILKDFGKWFKESNHPKIHTIKFKAYFFNFAHPKLPEEVAAYYSKLLDKVEKDVDTKTESILMSKIIELGAATDLSNLLKAYQDGEEVRLVEDGLATLEKHYEALKRDAGDDIFVEDDIMDLIAEDQDDSGLKWRLDCLNNAMRPLRSGDFGIVAARPDAGKTTFLCSEFTHMASQLPVDGSKPILWFNNEGEGNRIKKRLYQAALGATIDELIKLNTDGKLVEAYTKALRNINNIRIIDIHDWTDRNVIEVLEKHPTSLIVFDMIDNIKFTGMKRDARTDQILEQQYQWARVLGVKYSCPVIATSQISGDGEGLQWPTMEMLKDSRTGKQGAADFILMIGRSEDPKLDGSRFLSLPKNKLANRIKDPRAEVYFKPQIARYEGTGIC